MFQEVEHKSLRMVQEMVIKMEPRQVLRMEQVVQTEDQIELISAKSRSL
jgi:hypothetical protein